MFSLCRKYPQVLLCVQYYCIHTMPPRYFSVTMRVVRASSFLDNRTHVYRGKVHVAAICGSAYYSVLDITYKVHSPPLTTLRTLDGSSKTCAVCFPRDTKNKLYRIATQKIGACSLEGAKYIHNHKTLHFLYSHHKIQFLYTQCVRIINL